MPANPLERVREAAAAGPQSLVRAAGLLPRIVALLDTAEQLLTHAQALLSRLEQSELRIERVVGRVAASERAAREVIEATASTQHRADDVLGAYEPVLWESLKTVSYASSRFGTAQVDAAVAYLEFLPLLQAVDRDVLPLMTKLETVAPDLTELLAVSRALNELIGSVPGLGRAKKRVDEQLAGDEDVDE